MDGRIVLAGSLVLCLAGGCGDRTPAGARSANTAPGGPVTPTTGPTSTPQRGRISIGPVAYISDGDTIGVRLDGTVTRVRLLGIDAPETKDPNGAVECFGPEASAALTGYLARKTTVTVVTDPSQDERDRFGRLLAYVFRSGEGTPVNARLVADGAARVYIYRRSRPFRRLAAFRAAEAEARAAKRGLWAACPAPK